MRACKPDEVRILDPVTGVWCIAAKDGSSCIPQLPPAESTRYFGLFCDRSAQNITMLNFLSSVGQLLLEWDGDEAHDEWNCCRWAAEQCASTDTEWFPWMVLQQMNLVYSVNRAPFGTGAFFKVKQECWERLLKCGPTAAVFQKHKAGIARDAGRPVPVLAAEDQELWATLPELSSFQFQRDTIKNSRFFSCIRPSKSYDKEWSANEMLLEFYYTTVMGKTSEEMEALLAEVQEAISKMTDGKTIKEQLFQARKSGKQLLCGFKTPHNKQPPGHEDHSCGVLCCVHRTQRAGPQEALSRGLL